MSAESTSDDASNDMAKYYHGTDKLKGGRMKQLKHFIKKDHWKKDSVADAIGLYGLPTEVESSNEWKLFGMPRQYDPSIEFGDLRTNVRTIASQTINR